MEKSERLVSESPESIVAQFMQSVRPPHDWAEWLGLMKEAVTLPQKLGLLHDAFNVLWMGKYTPSDRIELFFAMADGWTDPELLRTEGVACMNEPRYVVGDNGVRTGSTESKQRQRLARKAFDMLVPNFFKMPGVETLSRNFDNKDQETRWMEEFVFSPLFSVVQKFFRVERGNRARIRNLSLLRPWGNLVRRSQSEEHAANFLLKLARFLWSWEGSVPAMQANVDSAKPWMVEVLAQLQELRLLEKWILGLDGPCLATLKEIALRDELNSYRGHPVNEGRRVVTIDEACYVGSQAGWLLKRHELVNCEYDRLVAIRAAEMRRDEAAKALKKLTRQE